VGEAKAQAAREGQQPFKKGVYFLGKVLWAKGYTELLDRLNEHEQRTGEHVPVDVYGTGPDAKVRAAPKWRICICTAASGSALRTLAAEAVPQGMAQAAFTMAWASKH